MPDRAPAAEDVQATFCATLVDEWARCGVQHAVVAPGSRSTPVALALADHAALTVHVHPDERSAGFLALGLALAGWEPVVVLTTSGTAAAELHPAVVEAHQANVPLLVCTADRPPELRDVGAPQTIDQTHLFGRAVRWFHDPGVADPAAARRWRPLAARAYAEATGGRRGPVHLNLPFREPLLGAVGELPPARAGAYTWRPPHQVPLDPVIGLDDLADRRGVLVAGAGAGDPELVLALADALGWPVLADHRSGARIRHPAVVSHADPLLRSERAAAELRPEVVVRLGELPASRVVAEWLAAAEADEIVVAGEGRWLDPAGTAAVIIDLEPGDLLARWSADLGDVKPLATPDWRDRWRSADDAAADAIIEVLAHERAPTEPGVARAVVRSVPDGGHLVVSSSMPIRDLEWFGEPRDGVLVLANRGANGIDGVVSTAVGVAAAGGPTAALLGDLAFVHDSNGLVGAADRGIDVVCVVVDNHGGGIFSFLPQADAIDAERFEQLYGTPHGADLVALAAAYGVAARTVDDDGVRAVADAFATGGVHVLVMTTDRGENRAVHERLAAAVTAAVDAVL